MSTNSISSALSCRELIDGPAVLLLGGPNVLLDGRSCEVPEGSKRLLAFTALNAHRIDRQQVAGCLWPAGSDQRAAGNLRSALWRLKCAGINVIESDKFSLRLRAGTAVDVSVISDWATRLIGGSAVQSDLCSVYWAADSIDLLPGWYDDWVVFERERIRQRFLHALEALSRHLVGIGRCAEAVDAAISAVGVDPLRESASRILIEAHLAEGNLIEGRRAFERYRDTVRRELGVEPSQQLTDLVRPAFRARRAPRWPAVSKEAGQLAAARGHA